jgi:alpha-2-macroglobulin
MKQTLARFLVLGTLLFSSLSGCQTNTPGPAPRPTDTVQPIPTTSPAATGGHLSAYLSQNLPLTPRVTAAQPDVRPGDDLVLAFDAPMDPAATNPAVTVTTADRQPVAGSLSWKDARTLVFHPQTALPAGAALLAQVLATAKSAQGQPLEEAASISFQVAGALAVTQVFPGNTAQDVAANATITAMFNRPVVALKIAEEQAGLVNPLEIDPPVEGRGEWINTSLYVFHPAALLAGGKTYQVKVKAGLMDASGDAQTALPADYAWSFSVIAPSVEWVSMNDNDLGNFAQAVPLNPVFQISFHQPMDKASVEAALRLTAGGTDVPLGLKWNDASTNVEARPLKLLGLETHYILNLDASAQDANGAALSAGFQREFTTVPRPAITGTAPNNNEIPTDPSFKIYFNAPLDFKSLADKVVFSPALDTQTHSWYDPNGHMLTFYGLAPSTKYTVKILPGMRDPYGNAITDGREVTFATQALPPSAMLAMPYTMPIYRTGGPQDFYLQYVNVDTVSAKLYHLSTDEFGKVFTDPKGTYSYTASPQDLVWQYSDTPEKKLDEHVTKDLTFSGTDGKPLPAGFYFLGVDSTPSKHDGPYLDTRLLAISSENITLKVSPGQILAWVTDLTSEKPVAGVHVTFYDYLFKPAAEAITDADGLAQATVDTTSPSDSQDKNNYQSQWVALIDEPQHFAFGASQWGMGASSDAFGLYQQAYRPWYDAISYVYTERPLYRPGQPVYFKGIVRADDDLAYSLPTQKEVEVVISNYQDQVFSETLPLSAIGTFDGKFDLDKATALGSYTLQVRWPGTDTNLGGVNFDVAEYRRPEFQMQTTAAPANVLTGDSFNVDLAANYYSGGGLANANVAWTLTSDPFSFSPPPDDSRYSFSDDQIDNWEYYRTHQQENSSQQIAQGQGQTGPDGKATFKLAAQPVGTGDSRRLTFEATVTDFSGSSVSGRAQVVMHKSAVYPGIRSQAYVGTVGGAQTFELVALDWDGKPISGQSVTVEIVERKWYSVQEETDNGQLTWTTSVQDTPVASFNGVKLDDKGLGKVSFTPAKGGVYRARVTASDARGNPASASAFIWVAGSDYIPWAQTNDRTFQLVADRDTYTPGQTAELLIASPFQGESWALVTVERGHVRKQEVLRLDSNSTLYHLPVTADMAPNVYVSVVVVKGVDDTNPRPNFKVGMAKLNVTTDEQTLKVTLTADHNQAAPRDKVQYTVQTATLDGKPAPAEVSLSLSDLATLSLRDAYAPPLLDFFYAPRSLSVTTGIGIVQDIEDYNATIAAHLTTPPARAWAPAAAKAAGPWASLRCARTSPIRPSGKRASKPARTAKPPSKSPCRIT